MRARVASPSVSPDIRTQIIGQPLLAAGPGPRETPIRADAELDHVTGLLMLREATEFRVLAPALPALRPIRAIIENYHAWTWAVPPNEFEVDGLRCEVFGVHDKPPRYATPGPGPWAVAYRITNPLLDADAPEWAELRRVGADVPADGTTLDL